MSRDVKRMRTLEQQSRPNPFFIAILAIFLIIEAVPIYLVVVNLFKQSDAIRMNPFGFPVEFTLENLRYVLTDKYKNIWGLYLNSILITGGGTVISLIFSAMSAYYIARSPGKLSRFLFYYFMAALSVPVLLLYVPLAYLLRFTGLNKSGIPMMIAIYVSFNVSFGMYIYSGFIKKLPKEMEEAARIDGASSFQVFIKVILPLLKPATATIAIFVGCALWNDFLTPLLLGGGIETITTGIYSAIGNHTTDWARVFAYVFMSSMPTVVFFLLSQKYFITGIASGAVKG